MMPIYVFSNGATATTVLNAIATMTNGSTNTFTTALSIAGVFAVGGGAIAYVYSHNIMTWIKWFAIYIGVMSIALGCKASVEVIDVTNPMQTTTVDHLPIGVALPASEATSISYGLTKAFDAIFHLPDDLGYSSSGLLFGAKQVVLSSLATLHHVENRFLFNQYYRQCMVPDVVINGKYSWMQLMETPDIIGFLGSISQSTLRGIYDGQGRFQTCQQAYHTLNQALSDEVKSDALPALAEKLLGSRNPAQAQARIKTTLPDSYHYYTGLSASAQAILEQNMAINATRNAIQNYGATVGATAGMENYSMTKQENTMLLANENSAAQAAYYLPMLQTVLFLLLCATFPLVVMLAIQPYFGVRVILSYLGGFIYLGSWPIFYAILNYIMTTSLYYGSKGMASHGFTLSNASQLAYDHSQAAGIAGYLELSIPVLSLMMVRGMGGVMSQAAQYFFGMAHSIAGQLAGETASGNLSLANTSLGNQSWNNISANKHDVNFTEMQGAGTHQTPYNTTITHTPLDRTIYHDNMGISQLPINVLSQRQLSAMFSTAYQTQQTHLHQTQAALANTQSAILNDLEQFSITQAKNDNYGHGASITTSSKTAEAINEIDNAIHNYADTHQCNEAKALQHLMTKKFHGNLSGSLGGYIPGTKTGVSGGVDLSSERNTIHQHTNNHEDTAQNSRSHAIQASFNHGVDAFYSATTNHHTDHTHSQTMGAVGQLSENLHQAESLARTVSEMESQSSSLQHLCQTANQHSLQISSTVMPAFVDFVQKQMPAEQASVLLANPTAANTQQLGQLAEQFAASSEGQQVMEQLAQSVQQAIPTDTAFRAQGEQSNATFSNMGEKAVAQQHATGVNQVRALQKQSGTAYHPLNAAVTEILAKGFQQIDQKSIQTAKKQEKQSGKNVDNKAQAFIKQQDKRN